MPRAKKTEGEIPPKITSENTEGDSVTPKKVTKLKVDVEDYLKPFEFHRDTGRPYGQVKDWPGVKYSAPEGDSAEMKAALLKQERIRILIPREGKGDKDVPKSVCLNGYRLDFPKQTYISVPEQIAELLKDSLEQSEAALETKRIDGDEAKQKQLTR